MADVDHRLVTTEGVTTSTRVTVMRIDDPYAVVAGVASLLAGDASYEEGTTKIVEEQLTRTRVVTGMMMMVDVVVLEDGDQKVTEVDQT